MIPNCAAARRLCLLAVLLLLSPSASMAVDAKHRQTIDNSTGGNVNDLKLRFKNSLKSKPKLWHSGLDANANGINDSGERVDASAQSNNNFNASWAQNTFGTIANGGRADIDFEGASGIDFTTDTTATQWTLDGVNKGVPSHPGEPMTIAFNAGTGTATVTFENPGATAITYTNIRLYKNNLSTNYTLAHFIEPTGTSVSAPVSIPLSPGQSQTISLGSVSQSGYVLAIAEVSADSDPSQLYNMASADTPLALPMIPVAGVVVLACLLALSGSWMLLRSRRGGMGGLSV